MRRIGEAIDAGRQQLDQPSRPERIGLALAAALRCRTARRPACRRSFGSSRYSPGFGSKPAAVGEGALARRRRPADHRGRHCRRARTRSGCRALGGSGELRVHEAPAVMRMHPEPPYFIAAAGANPPKQGGRQSTVNHSLGLTFYCSGYAAGKPDPCRTSPAPPAFWRPPPLAALLALSAGRLQDHQRRHHRLDRQQRSRAATPTGGASPTSGATRYRRSGNRRSRRISYAQALRATDQRAQAVAVLEQAAIRNSSNNDAARRLWPRAGRGRQSQAGARRAHPRAYAGPAGLAHPLCAGRGARPARPPRRGAALLCDRAQDHAGRAVDAVQSRPVLRAVEGPQARRRRRCGAPSRSRTPIRRCGRTSRWSSACRAASTRPRRSRAPTCRRAKPPPMSIICARCWRSRKSWKQKRAGPHRKPRSRTGSRGDAADRRRQR